MKLKNLLIMAPLVAMMLVSSAFGAMTYTEILQVPWGENEAELRPGSYPGLQTGPLSFQIEGETIIIYDTENKKLKRFGPTGYISSEEVPMNYMLDFYYEADELYLMGQHKIYQREDGQWKQVAEQKDLKYMFMGFRESENTVIARHPEGDLALGEQRLNKPAKLSTRVTRSLPSRVHIDLGYKNIDLHVPNVGSVDYIGSAPGGKHYIYAESITRQVPLAVARYIYLVDENGKVHARIILPRQQFSYIFKEFTVGPRGELYHMHSAREGIYMIRWEYDPDGKGIDVVYPERFSEVYHFNGYSEAEPAIANPPLGKASASSVTRAEAVEIGDEHTRHIWTATAANIGTTSTVTTPEWIQIGENVSIPYKWGGWNTIAQFDAGIAAGKLAGDRNTSVVDWGNSVGNDCSGLVSICWKTSQKYGTSTIHNVSHQLSNFNDLLPGDATNKAGSHIRLVAEWTPDGKLIQIEATSSGNPGWYTRYYTWNLSQITDYVPIRYNNITGGQVPRPTLLYTVSENDSVTLAWTADESIEFTGYKIYRQATGQTEMTVAATLPKGILVHTLPQDAGVHCDYKITAYQQDGSVSELESDIYAIKTGSSGKQVLIVDGFDRFSGSGSYAYPTHDFGAQTGKAMDAWDVAYDACANEAIIDGLIDLKDYDMVWWILGDESTVDETFNTVEQDSVKSYLDAGGKLFVSGSEIGWDLDNKGSASDKAFMHNYLKAAYAEDDAGNYNVSGAAGTVFEDLQFAYSQDGSHPGTYPEDYPDVLTTKNGSVIALKYGNNKTAAVSYEGTAPGGTVPGKVMVMGFPFETITSAASKQEVAGYISRFMGYDITLKAEPFIPQTAELFQNYPNPFNPETRISYQMHTDALVELDVFNLRGERVRQLVREHQSAGRHEIVFDGTNLPSGMYVYRLSVNNSMISAKKMVLSK